MAELTALGYRLESLDDLSALDSKYRDAIPTLVRALTVATDNRTLDGVVRALTVRWAKPLATRPLVQLFREVKSDNELGIRWTIGNALDVVWDDDVFEDLVALACDRSYGRSREMIVLGMARSKRPEAGPILMDLLDDPAVNGHATQALRKLKVAAARPGLERMTLIPERGCDARRKGR